MPEGHEPVPAHPIPELNDDEKHLAKLGYKQELSRSWSGFSNFAISFSIISILAGCFTTFGQALEQRRPDRDLVGLADHLGLHPDHRLHDVRAGVGVPDLRRHLLVGVQAGRPGGRLLHRLAEPDRSDRGDGLGRVRRRELRRHPHRACSATAGPTNYSLQRVFIEFVVDPGRSPPWRTSSRSHLLAVINNISVWWHVAGAALIIVHPDRRPGQPPEHRLGVHRADQQLRLRRRVHRRRCSSGSWCCRSASCSRSTRSPGSTPPPTCPRRPQAASDGCGQGHLALDLLLRRRRLDPAARAAVRRAGPGRGDRRRSTSATTASDVILGQALGRDAAHVVHRASRRSGSSSAPPPA